MLKTLLKKFLAACVIAGVSIAASAQTYPARPIKLIVPYAAGGTTDILGRMIGQKLQESMGQPVVIENKPGAAPTWVLKQLPSCARRLHTAAGHQRDFRRQSAPL